MQMISAFINASACQWGTAAFLAGNKTLPWGVLGSGIRINLPRQRRFSPFKRKPAVIFHYPARSCLRGRNCLWRLEHHGWGASPNPAAVAWLRARHAGSTPGSWEAPLFPRRDLSCVFMPKARDKCCRSPAARQSWAFQIAWASQIQSSNNMLSVHLLWRFLCLCTRKCLSSSTCCLFACSTDDDSHLLRAACWIRGK